MIMVIIDCHHDVGCGTKFNSEKPFLQAFISTIVDIHIAQDFMGLHRAGPDGYARN